MCLHRYSQCVIILFCIFSGVLLRCVYFLWCGREVDVLLSMNQPEILVRCYCFMVLEKVSTLMEFFRGWSQRYCRCTYRTLCVVRWTLEVDGRVVEIVICTQIKWYFVNIVNVSSTYVWWWCINKVVFWGTWMGGVMETLSHVFDKCISVVSCIDFL